MKRTLLLVAGLLICALGIFIPAAYADCTPGTAGNDTITCSGTDDPDGVNTGTGIDTVTITSGTVLDTIIAEGTQVTVIVNGTGALDTTAAGDDAIYMPYGGAVIFQGNLNSGWDGIYLEDSGSVNSTGNINALTGIGIHIYGNGSVVSMGDIVAGYNGIFVDGDGSIDSTGNVTVNSEELSFDYYEYYANDGLVLTGSGTINNTGDITVIYDDINGYYFYGASGIVLGNGGTINNTGDINVQYTGEYADYYGEGFGVGILLFGGGTINNTGNITADFVGIFAESGGYYYDDESELDDLTINNVGDINSLFGIVALTGGNVTINNVGDIHGNSDSIFFYYFYADVSAGFYVVSSNANLTNTGDIDEVSVGYFLYGDGSITNTGDIDAEFAGIIMQGDGTITQVGDITVTPDPLSFDEFMEVCQIYFSEADCIEGYDYYVEDYQAYYEEIYGGVAAGISGGSGDQQVDVNGSINAPIAVWLGAGNDTLNIRPFTIINGEIDMGEGDDVVRIGNYAQVNDTMYGGEGGEVDGDLLIIGAGQVCSEDAAAVAALGEDLSGLDPDGDTTTYLGQTYTWAEFEHLGREGFIAPCIGMIRDGRINAYDLGAPEALYCTVEHGVSVWELSLEGQGTFSFAISREQIVAAFEQAVASGQNQMFAEDGWGNQFYALSDGHTLTFISPELREASKQYVFTFEKDRCGEAEA